MYELRPVPQQLTHSARSGVNLEINDMKALEELSQREAVDRVAQRLVDDTLVIDMAPMAGFPTLMIMIKDTMPLFVWVGTADYVNLKARCPVETSLLGVGASVATVSSDADLDDLAAKIALHLRPAPIDNPMSFLD